jgi:hypothetical protein
LVSHIEGVWEQGAEDSEPKREEVTGCWRKLHDGVHNLYSLSYVIRMIKPRRMKWAGHVICMGEMMNVKRPCHLINGTSNCEFQCNRGPFIYFVDMWHVIQEKHRACHVYKRYIIIEKWLIYHAVKFKECHTTTSILIFLLCP